MSRYKEVFARQGGAFIDPTSVGSSVQWRVTYSFRPYDGAKKEDYQRKADDSSDSELCLSDCSRVINWGISLDTDSVDKLDAAIDQLKQCRTALVAAILARRRLRKKVGMPPADED